MGLRRELAWLVEDARRRDPSLTWEQVGERAQVGGGKGPARRAGARSYLHKNPDQPVDEGAARRLAALAGYSLMLVPEELADEVRALEARWRAAKGYPPRE